MSVAVSTAQCLLVKASLCVEAAERLQWPRLYSLGRLRSCDLMPSLVGDHGPVLRVLGWALTRMRKYIVGSYNAAVYKKAEEGLCVEQSRELFSDIMERGGASNACMLPLVNEPLPYTSCEFLHSFWCSQSCPFQE